MKKPMSFRECDEKYIKKVYIDIEKIHSLINISKIRVNEIHKIDKANPFLIIEQYYESIKEKLIVILLLDGKKSSNHECLIAYFIRNYSNYEYEANLIYTLKKLRNQIQYEGKTPTTKFFLEKEDDIKNILKLFDELILKKLNKTT